MLFMDYLMHRVILKKDNKKMNNKCFNNKTINGSLQHVV